MPGVGEHLVLYRVLEAQLVAEIQRSMTAAIAAPTEIPFFSVGIIDIRRALHALSPHRVQFNLDVRAVVGVLAPARCTQLLELVLVDGGRGIPVETPRPLLANTGRRRTGLHRQRALLR